MLESARAAQRAARLVQTQSTNLPRLGGGARALCHRLAGDQPPIRLCFFFPTFPDPRFALIFALLFTTQRWLTSLPA